ncbi:hypothetical protein O7635_20865 [Asanoa sp. WMMD1127]|uniref:hypothetical protein n=1 Tax=Asanoa sp. WMMD1127 TaxID=3016107 RepID=UPI002415C2D6|nr:hypothetical protein [Asanoa sp. WMMD1127]MDG4824310.1 hypothetical protein [Asanoa sp. WMMD1127]
MTRLRRAAVPLMGALLLLAACTAPGPARPRPHWAAEPARGAAPLDHTVTGPRAGLDAATFELASGVTTVTVRVADLGGDLYRVRTPDDASVAPWIARDGADLRLVTQGTGLGGPADVEVTLHRAVRWHLRLGGGAQQEEIDLRGGAVSGVEFVAGAGRIALTLPAPRGTVPVRMTGGAGEFRIQVTGDAPARVRVGGGAGSVVVDGVARTGIPGNTVIEGTGWASAGDRYDVDVAAGVSSLVLARA